MKKIILLLCYLLLAVKGWTHDFEVNGIYYNLRATYGPGVEVTHTSNSFNSYSCEVTIPNTVTFNGNTYAVTSIGDNAFRDCSKLTSIFIGTNVSYIGSHAFSGCVALEYFSVSPNNSNYSSEDGVLFSYDKKKIYAYPNAKSSSYAIPEDVESIFSAFEGCINLTSITIPNSMKNIDQNSFSGCLSLKEFIVSDDNPLFSTLSGVLFNKDKTELIAYPNAKSDIYSIPDGVTSIKSYAFYTCEDLVSISIPNSVVSINSHSFYGCKGLTSVEIPKSVTYIGSLSFKYCTNLKEFIVSDQNKLFSTLDGVLCNKNKTSLLAYPYAKSTTYTVPEQITSIANYAFADCEELISLFIPNSVKKIGSSILAGCKHLQSLSIPFMGSSISDNNHLGYLFEEGDGWDCATPFPEKVYCMIKSNNGIFIQHSYYIPLSLTEISVTYQRTISRTSQNTLKFGFEGCTNLKKIDLPLATRIVDRAFYGCTYLEEINLPVAEFIGNEVFYNCQKLITLSLPLATSFGDHTFSYCTNLETLNLPVATSIPNGYSFFQGCSELKTLLLPKIKHVDYIDFPSSLTVLNIGSLESLRENLLSKCTKLEELTVSFIGTGNKDTATGVNGLFGSLFSSSSSPEKKAIIQYYSETKSRTFYFPPNLRKVTVTEECEEIQYGAFYGCSTIKEITLPYTLYMVGEKALYGCAGLTDIYCKGAAPAAAYDNSFTGIRVTSCKLHIPYNTTDLYKASDGWKKFFYMQEEAPLTINVTKNILNAGIILGITEYQQGATVNLSARANSGYRFKCWMDNGEIVSEEDNYSFTINENKNLLAVFIPVQNENSLNISTESNTANFTWKTIDDTNEYILKIYSDMEMKKEIASFKFDAEGELVTRTASIISYRVADLKPEITYYYSLTANDIYNKTLSEQVGTFSTTPTGIEEISGSTNILIKVEGSFLRIENAQGKMVSVYNLQGVCQTVIYKAKNTEIIQIDKSGIYLIKVDKFLQKVIIK